MDNQEQEMTLEGIAYAFMNHLKVSRGDLVFFPKHDEPVNILKPLFENDGRYRNLLLGLLKNKSVLTRQLLNWTKDLINDAWDLRNSKNQPLASKTRLHFLHTALWLSFAVKNKLAKNEKPSYDGINRQHRQLLRQGLDAMRKSTQNRIPIYSFLATQNSHYIRYGEPAGLSIYDYVNELVSVLLTKPRMSLPRHPKRQEPKKHMHAYIFKQICGKPQPSGRMWHLILKNVNVNGADILQICSISFCDDPNYCDNCNKYYDENVDYFIESNL